MEKLKAIIRDIPDFPKEGIIFKDITPLLMDHDSLKQSIDILTKRFREKGVTKVIGIESRGFIFAPTVAYMIGAGFVPVRKPGKLPYDTISIEYELEYGTDTLEIHKDAIVAGDKVAIVDDLIATGGTAKAVAEMVHTLGGEIVELAFVIELAFLDPRSKLGDLPVYSIIQY